MSWTEKNIVILGIDELKYVLDNYDITHVISLMHGSGVEELKKTIPDNVKHHVEVFQDIDTADLRAAPSHFVPPKVEHIENVIEFVESSCDAKSKIIVHCVAGIGRSPAMALALYIKAGLSEIEALERMLKIRYTSWPNNLIMEHIDTIFDTEMAKVGRAWKQYAAKLDFKSGENEEKTLNNFQEFKEAYNNG